MQNRQSQPTHTKGCNGVTRARYAKHGLLVVALFHADKLQVQSLLKLVQLRVAPMVEELHLIKAWMGELEDTHIIIN
jgi:hypothetical protein